MYLTFRSQYYSCKVKNVSNCKLALEYAHRAKEEAQNLPNILHLFTSTVIELAETSAKSVTIINFNEAELSIDKAIGLNGEYARYYATKANLLSLMGRYSEAKDMIQKAIEIEPSGKNGYALRIGDYQIIRLKIQFLEHSNILGQQHKESVVKLEEVRLRIIELLGILSAIIAILVTSTQAGKGMVFNDAARLLVIAGGVILIVFSSYSIIFFREKLRPSQLLVLVFGSLLVFVFMYLPDNLGIILNFINK